MWWFFSMAIQSSGINSIEQSDLNVVMVFSATFNNISVISWRSIIFEKIFIMVFTIKEKIREKIPKIHWFKQITIYSNLPCHKITAYSNLPCQENYSLQQFTASSKLPFTAIYRVKKITVYSNLLCQANYR